MNKYINEIEKSNNIIKSFINEFNKLLLEEKSKKIKGPIKTETIKEHYVNTLFKSKDFKTYMLSKAKENSVFSFDLRKNKNVIQRKNGIFIYSAYFEINKKNNEVKLHFINFKNESDKKISIDYYLSYDSDKKEFSALIVLICKKTGSEKTIAIGSEAVNKFDDVITEKKPSREFEINKEVLNSFADLAKINRELFFDYLFLGKDIEKEMIDLLSISNDIDWKNESIFRMNFKNKESKLTTNEKLKP